MKFRLPCGEIVRKNDEHFSSKAKQIYGIYDVVCDDCPNEIKVIDIAITAMMNTGIQGNTGIEILEKRNVINEALEQIPEETDLLETCVSTEIDDNNFSSIETRLKDLINKLCEIKGIDVSTATKILHRKRRNLIPIFDRVVEKFYRRRYIRKIPVSKPDDKFINLLRCFKRDLKHIQETQQGEIERILELLVQQGTPLTKVRLLEFAIWCTHRD
jgi:hypothetical protein